MLRRLIVLFAAPVLAGPLPGRPLLNGIELANRDGTIRVEALTNEVLRIRFAPGGTFAEDAGWAVAAPAALRLSPSSGRFRMIASAILSSDIPS